MIKIKQTKLFYPDYLAETILDIDGDELKKIGLTHLVFDLDNTLIHGGLKQVSKEYTAKINMLKQQGFSVFIGTNTRRDISVIQSMLGVSVVQPNGLTFKPLRSFFEEVITATGTIPDHIAMVGDHIINDVVGANRAGLTTILVDTPHLKASRFKQLYLQKLTQHD